MCVCVCEREREREKERKRKRERDSECNEAADIEKFVEDYKLSINKEKSLQLFSEHFIFMLPSKRPNKCYITTEKYCHGQTL
jgi:hypothetical protein